MTTGSLLDRPTPDASTAAEINQFVLALPEAWVIDDLARERLARQLTRAPDHVCGVVAPTSAVPSGTSYRVHAERLGLKPLSAARETSQLTWPGAVLVRPGVSFEVRGGTVEVERGRLLVDPGAHAHDPWRPLPRLDAASPLGRPPFPRRPLVVFLACEPEVEALDWARSLVNNLVRRDVEGRLAMFSIAEGLHLTQQCTPTEESIRALSPDVIVALDQVALDRLPSWCVDNRSVVAIELTPDVATTVELVSWQLGRAQGRLRARIGRRIDAPSLVSLVNRLCSGPHAAPPTDTPAVLSTATAVRAVLTRKPAPLPEPVTRRSVVVVTGDDGSASHDVLGGLVDHLVGAGHAAEVRPIGTASAAAREAELAIITSSGYEARVVALVKDREAAGRPTVWNIEVSDVFANTSSPEQVLRFVVEFCSGATTGSPAVHALIRSRGLRAHLLPPLLTRGRVGELRSARSWRARPADPVIGWTTGLVSVPTPDYLDAVADAMLALLAERSRLSIQVIGEPSPLPDEVVEHPRVSTFADPPSIDTLTRWLVHTWSPPLRNSYVADNTLPLVESSGVGVPPVLPKAALTSVGGYPPPGILVDGPAQSDSWAEALRLLLDDDATASRESRAAIRRFDATHGPTAAEVAVNRFLGWALYRGSHA
jgi:hypothetical protein